MGVGVCKGFCTADVMQYSEKYFSSSVTRATDCVSASQEEEELLLGHGNTVAVETGTCI